MKGKKATTTERLKQLTESLEKTPLPGNCVAAFHLYKATKDEINELARDHKTIPYQRPNGDLYFNFKYKPTIDIYIWE